MNVQIFLAEDQGIVREGIRALLESEPWITVVGEASTEQAMLTKVAELMPDLVLMDMNLPALNDMECTRLLKKNFPQVKVLVLSVHDEIDYLIGTVEAGANGYLLKNSSREELLFAIRQIAGNGWYIGSELTLKLLSKCRSAPAYAAIGPKPELDLSDREIDVLRLILEGYTNVEIAAKLFTSVRTIETRRKRLLEKTGTGNTATLVRYAIVNGLVK